MPNPARFWSEVGTGLPRNEIRMILPVVGSGHRALFDDLVMEAGCRYVPDIRLLFEAAYRRTKCITARTDGRVVDVRADQAVAALLAAPAGTLAVVSYDQLLASGGNLVAVPARWHRAFRRVHRQPRLRAGADLLPLCQAAAQPDQQGIGVVRGIHEFLVESTSEQAAGPGGYLLAAGLVPLVPAERAAQRRIAEQGRLMSR